MFPHLLMTAYAVEIAATVFVVRRWSAGFSLPRMLAAWVATVLSCLLAFGISLHACHAGVPILPWLLPSVLLGLTVGAAQVRPALLLGWVHFVCAVVLSLLWSTSVHGPEWVGVRGRLQGEAIDGEREWHSALTGLYRRVRSTGAPDSPVETVARPPPE